MCAYSNFCHCMHHVGKVMHGDHILKKPVAKWNTREDELHVGVCTLGE